MYRNYEQGADTPGLTVIDKFLRINIETEKMLRFVHATMNYDLTYLTRLDVVTFFQLLREADKIQKSKAKQ